jgi:negative regulator of replication initiation
LTEVEDKMPLTDYTQQAIIHVDATPDKEYPLRILRAYRENCNVKWATSTDPDAVPITPLFVAMNQAQDKRAAILDWAIAVLERAGLDNNG